MCSCQCTAGTNFNNTHLGIPAALSEFIPLQVIGCGGLLQCKAWSCISQGSYYSVLTIFSSSVSVQNPSTSVCISWYRRQLITIISQSVPSKKQIGGTGQSA